MHRALKTLTAYLPVKYHNIEKYLHYLLISSMKSVPSQLDNKYLNIKISLDYFIFSYFSLFKPIFCFASYLWCIIKIHYFNYY